jgi:predicted ATPase
VALLYLAGLHHYSGDREKTAQVSVALTALTDRYRLWLKDYGWMLRRWAERDAEQLVPILEALRASDQQVGMTFWPSLEAELLAERGHHDAAIERLDACMRLAHETGETYYLPELYRFKAISLEARDARAAPESEEYLRQAIAFAHEQSALTLELRSTVMLCRSMLRQGRSEEARELLRPISAWPAEHAALPELGEARALLRDLAA